MDTRQGNIYPTRQGAVDAGVPDFAIASVTPISDDVLRITSGPMKGRYYKRTATGLLRVTKEGRPWSAHRKEQTDA